MHWPGSECCTCRSAAHRASSRGLLGLGPLGRSCAPVSCLQVMSGPKSHWRKVSSSGVQSNS
eukprot:16430210-Heterocapsa_arctica.AAC.1